MKLLEKLIEVRGTSGDEAEIKDFLLNHIHEVKQNWKVQPQIIAGEEFQDAIILVFGKPKTALFAHIDTIGYMSAYGKNLIKIGGPRAVEGYELVGQDSKGEIETELMLIEDENGSTSIQYVLDREIDRGTPLSFKPNFRETEEYIQSPYLDNRLGVWNALQVAETLENGIIVFSTYEEHGGGSVGFLGRYIYDNYQVRQALISDITWVTDGVHHGKGVAISMRDSGIPRRKYLNRILSIASKSGIAHQLEVESAGGSDGTMLQKTDLPFDWCFIGAPEDNVHSPDEKVHKFDIACMVDLYKVLMQEL
ncbi:Putative aminopeptidase FrvX [Lishizhenia tianjinensis]|uniref:Putative aminopeptidase FrvX n=1 Tax=Lishizhenia tianjinensis TaxID=477690 RepID=A0A1I7ALB3_9FLAO|nr:aminopeptidase [Lishizhenia tianjinensis]SFT75728.1 Putative aminopeptidase FrvX [Lishizhenia tianjinensis]